MAFILIGSEFRIFIPKHGIGRLHRRGRLDLRCAYDSDFVKRKSSRLTAMNDKGGRVETSGLKEAYVKALW